MIFRREYRQNGICGTAITAMAISLFLVPNKIVNGGASGLATVIYYTIGVKPSLANAIINAVLLLLSLLCFGWKFVTKTLFSIGLLTVLIEVFSYIPPVTDNMMLATIFGAVLYGIIALFISTMSIDWLMRSLNISKLAFIITDKGQEIAEFLISTSPRGVTLVDVTGVYSNTPKKMMICALKESELPEFQRKILEKDGNAFIIYSESQQIVGNGFYISNTLKERIQTDYYSIGASAEAEIGCMGKCETGDVYKNEKDAYAIITG